MMKTFAFYSHLVMIFLDDESDFGIPDDDTSFYNHSCNSEGMVVRGLFQTNYTNFSFKRNCGAEDEITKIDKHMSDIHEDSYSV